MGMRTRVEEVEQSRKMFRSTKVESRSKGEGDTFCLSFSKFDLGLPREAYEQAQLLKLISGGGREKRVRGA